MLLMAMSFWPRFGAVCEQFCVAKKARSGCHPYGISEQKIGGRFSITISSLQDYRSGRVAAGATTAQHAASTCIAIGVSRMKTAFAGIIGAALSAHDSRR